MQIKFAPKMNKKITKTIKSDIKTTTLFDKKISCKTCPTVVSIKSKQLIKLGRASCIKCV